MWRVARHSSTLANTGTCNCVFHDICAQGTGEKNGETVRHADRPARGASASHAESMPRAAHLAQRCECIIVRPQKGVVCGGTERQDVTIINFKLKRTGCELIQPSGVCVESARRAGGGQGNEAHIIVQVIHKVTALCPHDAVVSDERAQLVAPKRDGEGGKLG